MSEKNREITLKDALMPIVVIILVLPFLFFKREIDLTMWEGLTFKQARVYVKEKDDLRKGIEKLKRENELIELRQELEKLKRNKLGR